MEIEMGNDRNILKKTIVVIPLAIFCQALWGSVFPVIKKCNEIFAISDIGSTLQFAGVRFIIAGSVLLFIDLVKNRRFPRLHSSDVGKLLLLGTIQTGLTYCAQFIAMLRIPSINCSIINGLSSVMNLFWATIFFSDDRITLRKAIGAGLGVAGVLFCFLFGSSTSAVTFLGEGLMLLSVILFCLGANYSRFVTRTVSSTVAAGFNLLIGGVELFSLSLVLGGNMGTGTPLGWGLMGFLAASSSICLLLWTALGAANGVGNITVYQSVNPVAGAVAAALIVGENVLETRYVVSVLLIVLGIVVINTKRRQS